MTKQINVKVVCACGDEVAESRIKRVYYAEKGILRAAEDIQAGDALVIEDRPSEPDPRCACCKLNHPAPYTCDHCDPHYERLDKRRSSTVC